MCCKPRKQSSSHVELPAGFLSEHHAELKCFLCGLSRCRTRTEGRMLLMIFCFMSLAPVLSWRGGMFSIWSLRQQRSPTPKSKAGASTQQDTMFTTGTVVPPCTHLLVLITTKVTLNPISPSVLLTLTFHWWIISHFKSSLVQKLVSLAGGWSCLILNFTN